MIVAGDAPAEVGAAALASAAAAGVPLIAEPSSNARAAGALRCGRLLLAGPLAAAVERVIVFGHPTLSRPVMKLLSRPDVDVVLHSHAVNCAILACCRLDIPPIHYMIGVAGGKIVKCSGYAPFGTQKLSELALEALGPRMACLLGNHGVIALGKTPAGAFHVLEEIENLARIYIGTRALGGGTMLSDKEMDVVLERFKTYGKQAKDMDPSITERVEPPVFGGAKRR